LGGQLTLCRCSTCRLLEELGTASIITHIYYNVNHYLFAFSVSGW
jgi:hypothetical protein